MVDTPGRCRDLDYCSIGQLRTLVRVPLGSPFVCPECGKPLRAAVALGGRLSRARIAWLSAGTLGILVVLYLWMAPGRQHHQLARQALAPPKPPPSLQAPPPPARQADAAGGRVRMDCTIDPAGIPTNCTVVHGEPPAAPAAPAAVPPPVANPPAAVPAKPAPPPAAAPDRPAPGRPALGRPAPGHPASDRPALDRPVSRLPVAGGAPPYPSEYVHDGRAGEVSVTCIIDEEGEPTHCRVRAVSGGRRFAEATVNWLNTGQVRFAPALRAGQPVPEERHWNIAFPPR